MEQTSDWCGDKVGSSKKSQRVCFPTVLMSINYRVYRLSRTLFKESDPLVGSKIVPSNRVCCTTNQCEGSVNGTHSFRLFIPPKLVRPGGCKQHPLKTTEIFGSTVGTCRSYTTKRMWNGSNKIMLIRAYPTTKLDVSFSAFWKPPLKKTCLCWVFLKKLFVFAFFGVHFSLFRKFQSLMKQSFQKSRRGF